MNNAAPTFSEIGFDPLKSEKNIADPARGFGFEIAAKFEFDTALIVEDDRKNYGEIRFVALGLIGDRVYAIVYTLRGPVLWVISLRKANKREIKRYVSFLES